MLEFLFYRLGNEKVLWRDWFSGKTLELDSSRVIFYEPPTKTYANINNYEICVHSDGTVVSDYPYRMVTFPCPAIAVYAHQDEYCAVLCTNGQQYYLDPETEVLDSPQPLERFYYHIS